MSVFYWRESELLAAREKAVAEIREVAHAINGRELTPDETATALRVVANDLERA